METLLSKGGESNIISGDSEWNIINMVPSLAALAQHYGLPTRLLDWTRQSMTAAFFAAKSAYDNEFSADPKTLLVVWAFYFPALGKHNDMAQLTDPVRILTAPSATNPNLKAQQAVFTLLNHFYTREDEAEGKYPALDKFLEEKADSADPEHSDSDKLIVSCKLQKFTLPISAAKALLHLLAKLDITPSAIYPGFHSIPKDLQMFNSFRKMGIDIHGG